MNNIETFKAIIMANLADGEYFRRRELAWHCRCWVASPDLTKAISELEVEGKIAERMHRDPANCDTYIEYYAI